MSTHDTPEVGSGETVGERVHWIGENRNTLHGNGAGSKDMERVSGDEDDVTCNLCLSLLARDDVRERTAPASPDPVQPADAGEGLSEGERVDLSMAIIRAVYNGDGQVFYSVERILAAREAAWAEKYAAVVGERDRAVRDVTALTENYVQPLATAEAALATALRERNEAQEHVAYHLRDYALNSEPTGDLAVDMARLNGRLMAERDAALREKAEDRARVEAVEALDIPEVLAPHQRKVHGPGACVCGEWPEPGVTWLDHLAAVLRAALAIPTATGDE